MHFVHLSPCTLLTSYIQPQLFRPHSSRVTSYVTEVYSCQMMAYIRLLCQDTKYKQNEFLVYLWNKNNFFYYSPCHKSLQALMINSCFKKTTQATFPQDAVGFLSGSCLVLKASDQQWGKNRCGRPNKSPAKIFRAESAFSSSPHWDTDGAMMSHQSLPQSVRDLPWIICLQKLASFLSSVSSTWLRKSPQIYRRSGGLRGIRCSPTTSSRLCYLWDECVSPLTTMINHQ